MTFLLSVTWKWRWKRYLLKIIYTKNLTHSKPLILLPNLETLVKDICHTSGTVALGTPQIWLPLLDGFPKSAQKIQRNSEEGCKLLWEICKFASKVTIQRCSTTIAPGRKTFFKAKGWLYFCACAQERNCLRPSESRGWGGSGPCHLTGVPSSPRDGAGRGDPSVAAAESSSWAGPTGEEGAGARSAGSGLRVGRACGSGASKLDAFAGPASQPRKGRARGVTWGGSVPCFSRGAVEAEFWGATSAPQRGSCPSGHFWAQTPRGRAAPWLGSGRGSLLLLVARDPVTPGPGAEPPRSLCRLMSWSPWFAASHLPLTHSFNA